MKQIARSAGKGTLLMRFMKPAKATDEPGIEPRVT
jgi:hypothetical protein